MPLKKLHKCCHTEAHPSHTASMPRMNRAIGQLEGAKKMIESGRCCIEILTQLRAARTAVKAIETEIFKRHLENCVVNSFRNPKNSTKKITEVKQLLDFMK